MNDKLNQKQAGLVENRAGLFLPKRDGHFLSLFIFSGEAVSDFCLEKYIPIRPIPVKMAVNLITQGRYDLKTNKHIDVAVSPPIINATM